MSDKTQSIQKAHTANVMPTGGNAKGGQLGTIFGIESGDIRIPYVYLVRSGTLSAKLADGSRAPVGSLFHSVKKEAVDKLEVLIAHASKGISREKKKDPISKKKETGATGEKERLKRESIWKKTENKHSFFFFFFLHK